MSKIIHREGTRGFADHGWLKSYHTFSFGSYHNPERMRFGVLRVLNDDRVAGGMGFGTHPHDNMEIISIPLEGDLQHKDSMGNVQVIRRGEIQVMSAGAGITHSEYNLNKDEEVAFLQIWIFPEKRNVEPRYDQQFISEDRMQNNFLQILSPNPDDNGVWIHQQAWFHMTLLSEGNELTYALKKEGNGVYFFLIDGKATVAGEQLERRDGIGITDVNAVSVRAKANAHILVMEVPMSK